MSSKVNQVLWWCAAAGLLAGAGMLHEPLDRQGEQYELTLPNDVVAQKNPHAILLTMAPGGLRAPLINYLWMRSENLKQQGRCYDALQLADLICKLEPHFPGVWDFQAWNMAWNISVQTHTPQERWLWVTNGIKLLRDQAIPNNPKSELLYERLAWIFYSKMGQYTDDMNSYYKVRWAAEMHHVMGSPPMTGDTKDAIAAFEPVADEALLDKEIRRQGRELIQSGKLAELLAADAKLARYVELLGAQGVKCDRSFIEAYLAYGDEPNASSARLMDTGPLDERQKAVNELMDSADYAPQRAKMLAFLRAQILWNEYRMDPSWMLANMRKYGPLDWRSTWAHALYWATYGMKIGGQRNELDTFNVYRGVLNSMKELTWTGRMVYVENPRKPEEPGVKWLSDWRFIETTHQLHIELGHLAATLRNERFDDNLFKAGHQYYLIDSIAMLYSGYRRQEAQRYYDWLLREYKYKGGEWDQPGVEDFLVMRMAKEESISRAMAVSQISTSLETGLAMLAVGEQQAYQDCMKFAKRVYDEYAKTAPERNKLPALSELAAATAQELLLRPQASGYSLKLVDRAKLYVSLDDRIKTMVYPTVLKFLPGPCRREGLDFDKAFPAPRSLPAD